MTDQDLASKTRNIVVEDFFPHAAEVVWQALTDGALIARWLMDPIGFQPVVGNRFTFKTKPAGVWDGTIRCEVLVVEPMQCLAYAWRGGDDSNVGYGSLLDTVVTWTLLPVEGGTRVRIVHSGFVVPKNDRAFRNMSQGWKAVVPRLVDVVGVLH